MPARLASCFDRVVRLAPVSTIIRAGTPFTSTDTMIAVAFGSKRKRALPMPDRGAQEPSFCQPRDNILDSVTPFGFNSFWPIPWFAWGLKEASLRVDDRIRKTVVFIGRADKGPFVPYGTGFITATLLSVEQGWQTVITARHVIDDIDAENVHVRLNNNDGEAGIIEISKTFWFSHPDKRIDVAVSPSV